MPTPFYQGKLDVFCAMYAVLNGLQITHGLRALHARDILHETLLELAATPDDLRAVLEQRTDYVPLVDGMLHAQARRFPLEIVRPFQGLRHAPSPRQFWQACRTFLEGGCRRVILFRFLRYLFAEAAPLNRHWTAVDWVRGDTMHLFDCSREEGAILDFAPGSFVTRPEDLSPECLICIDTATARFLSPR